MLSEGTREALLQVAKVGDASITGVIAIIAVLRDKGMLDDDDTRIILDAISKDGRWETLEKLQKNLRLLLPGYEPTPK